MVINIVKKCAQHIRTSVKILIITVIAGLLIAGLTLYIYKPTYIVTLDGEFVGYTQDKSKLQARINNYIQQEENNLVFIQVDKMPEYKLCMLKKDISTNDDEIYDRVVNSGTSHYRYYALLKDGEEKYYFSTFEDAESVVNKLKDKDSANVDKLTVVEKYNTEVLEIAEVDSSVDSLYEKKIVPVVTVAKRSSGSGGIGVSGMNNSNNVVDLGVSLARPVSGTITSRFGYRSRDNHKGLDIGAPGGTTIYAAAGGTVSVSAYGYNGGYGNYVIISHGNGVQTLYGHCSSLIAEEGSYVSQGEPIARVGSTGISTGNHLHFEVRVNGIAQDPQNYVY